MLGISFDCMDVLSRSKRLENLYGLCVGIILTTIVLFHKIWILLKLKKNYDYINK